MMTQEQIIETFKSYPKSMKASTLRRLMRDFEDDLADEANNNGRIDTKSLSRDELIARRKLAVDRLRGIASVPGKTPPTDEEWREERTNYVLEKHK